MSRIRSNACDVLNIRTIQYPSVYESFKTYRQGGNPAFLMFHRLPRLFAQLLRRRKEERCHGTAKQMKSQTGLFSAAVPTPKTC